MEVIEETTDAAIDAQRGSRTTGAADWSFVRQPKWILSHLFALALIVSFVSAGLWQVDRLGQRRDGNARIEARALQASMPLDAALQSAGWDGVTLEAPADDLDFVAVSVTGQFIDSDFTRVANRSQNSRGGDWSVGIFETDSGLVLAVNRGFVLRSETVAGAPNGVVELEGVLRLSRTKGWIGGTDNPDADRMPRLNIDDFTVRAYAAGLMGGRSVVPMWLQLTAVDGVAPDAASTDAEVEAVVVPRPIPLDDLGEGNHFSYAVQWFLLATLSVVIYSLMLRRIAQRPRK